jgi:hypothetical protein
MRHLLAAICATLSLAAVPAQADDVAEMSAAANGFYGVYKTFHPPMAFPATRTARSTNRSSRPPWTHY